MLKITLLLKKGNAMQNGWNIEEWRLEDGWIPVLEEPSSVFLSFHFAKWMSSCLWSYDLSLSTFLFTLFSSSERCSGKDRLQLHWDMINLPRIQSFINFFIESAGYVSWRQCYHNSIPCSTDRLSNDCLSGVPRMQLPSVITPLLCPAVMEWKIRSVMQCSSSKKWIAKRRKLP